MRFLIKKSSNYSNTELIRNYSDIVYMYVSMGIHEYNTMKWRGKYINVLI